MVFVFASQAAILSLFDLSTAAAASSSALLSVFNLAAATSAAFTSSGVYTVEVTPVWHLSPSPQPSPGFLPSHLIPAVLPTAAVLAASVVVAASAAITVEAIRAATMKLFIVSF